MIRFNYPDGDWCFRALHTVHAIFHDAEGRLIARAEKPDRSDMYEFEINSFEVVSAGVPLT